jgi:hypothetical protein
MDLRFQPNQAIVIPLNNCFLFSLPDDKFEEWFYYEVESPRGLTTMNASVGAGFYGDVWGPMPFILGHVPVERYLVYRAR